MTNPQEVAESGSSAVIEWERIQLSEARANVGRVWLNRPEKLNAINSDVLKAFEEALRQLDADPTVRVILISGRGRAFSAGADLKHYLTFHDDGHRVREFVSEFQRILGIIPFLSKPVVALVNGIAVAGGLELVLACDFAYAATSARLGDAHLEYGQIGGGGALTLLSRAIGPARARELIFSAELIDAGRALEWGLVNAVVADDALSQRGLTFAEGVAQRSAAAVAGAKHVANVGYWEGSGVAEGLRLELAHAALHNLTSQDAATGLRAFADGRKPDYG